MKLSTKELVLQAMIAALYVAVTIGLYSWSFGEKQLRVSEFLLILVLFSRKNMVGIVVGTLIANLLGPNGLWDVVLGTFATFLVCLAMSVKQPRPLAYLWASIINALVIGLMLTILYETPFVVGAISVFISEFLVTFLPFIIIGPTILNNQRLQELLT